MRKKVSKLFPSSRVCAWTRASISLALAWIALAVAPAQAQTTNFVLGTTALVEGPSAGSDSVVLAVTPPAASWTATTNASWLHLSGANQNGVGSTNVIFSFDANPGATRVGTLTIGNQTLTVTQAALSYVQAQIWTDLSARTAGGPGIAVDQSGDIYLCDGSGPIKKWFLASNTFTTIISSGLTRPWGLAVDGAGNLYIADSGNNAIKEWIPANDTVTNLVTSGLSNPRGVAVDSAGNVYIADTGNNAIKEWVAASNIVITLLGSGLNSPEGVAVDVAGNVYIADTVNNELKEWFPANNSAITIPTLTSTSYMDGVAVDGSGNIYMAQNGHVVYKWTVATGSTVKLPSPAIEASFVGVTVDKSGNVSMGGIITYPYVRIPFAFIDPTPRSEAPGAGIDTLSPVLPTSTDLFPPFAPTSDQSWLSITGVTNGVVSYSFTANNSVSSRAAHISLLGQAVPVTQAGITVTPPAIFGTTVLSNGALQFAFSNNQGASFSVVSSTNVLLPLSNWTVVGAPSNIGSGVFQFTTQSVTNDPQRFYRVRSP